MKTEPYREAPYLRRAYVLGHPIAHSLSPALHRAAYDFLGEQNLGYDRRDTLPDDLPEIMHGVRHPKGTEDAPYIAGLSVTMPLKTAVIQYCDELSETARVTGAVNTVYPRGEKVLGDNTDAVSYTHLDVYKRQGLLTLPCLSPPQRLLSPVTWLWVTPRGLLCTTRSPPRSPSSWILSILTRVRLWRTLTTLSATVDVYKRQVLPFGWLFFRFLASYLFTLHTDTRNVFP